MFPCCESCQRMATMCPCIGYSYHVNDLDNTIFCGTYTNFPIPCMSTSRAVIRFMTIVYDIGWLFQFPCDKSWEHFCTTCLFRAETTANTRFDNTDLSRRKAQSTSHMSTNVEWYLRRTSDDKTIKLVYGSKGPKSFHRRL